MTERTVRAEGRLAGRAGAATSTYLLQLAGIRAIRTGPEVFLDDVGLGVPAVFSGWSMIMTFLALHLGWVLLTRRSPIEKACVLAAALPAAMVAGVVRVLATAALHQSAAAEEGLAAMQACGGCFVLLCAGVLLEMEVLLLSQLFVPVFDSDMFPAEEEDLFDEESRRQGQP